ncbi:LysR family transcriptional regulator [Alicyclobacillus sp. ALC3]|uniref:LysR family transcriptional regulator n=1 Tax=Alicyclobacillus sp. ALC3 TaxID=2796143 RepID=UPI002377D2E3|nr:LysR family transcriptional regulator [Alicyclobacillus sp. ALC3]
MRIKRVEQFNDDGGSYFMETKDIQLFLAIARIGSLSRTAEQLFMSQSTVTTRLQRLEHAVGYTLFDRRPDGVKLTVNGERFLQLAERMTAIETKMTQPVTASEPILRVMSGRAFVSTDVPACLSRMLKHENVRLEVRMGLYDEMKDALLADQVDFCFMGEPIYHPHIRLLEFEPDVIDLIVPKGHYWTHDFPGIRGLHHAPFIAFARDDAPFRKRVMGLLAKVGVYPKVRMELDSIDGIKAMVGHGLGVSCLPRRTLHDAEEKGYVRIPLSDPAWVRPTFLIYRENLESDPIAERFIRVVTNHYEQTKQN